MVSPVLSGARYFKPERDAPGKARGKSLQEWFCSKCFRGSKPTINDPSHKYCRLCKRHKSIAYGGDRIVPAAQQSTRSNRPGRTQRISKAPSIDAQPVGSSPPSSGGKGKRAEANAWADGPPQQGDWKRKFLELQSLYKAETGAEYSPSEA